MEYGRTTDRAEAEAELRAVIALTYELGRDTGDLVWRGESGERCKDATGALLAGKAVADASAEHFVGIHVDAELAAVAGGSSWDDKHQVKKYWPHRQLQEKLKNFGRYRHFFSGICVSG